MEKRNKDMAEANHHLIKKNKKTKWKYNILDKELSNTKFKLSRVEDKVNLIQSRDAIKAFIDFFYQGLNCSEPISNEERVKLIVKKLNNKQNIGKIDSSLLSMINNLLHNCDEKLKLGNDFSHKLDKTEDVLNQIFKIIDPNNAFDKVKDKLIKVKAHDIISKLINVRESSYFNKSKLFEEEKAIYKSMPKQLNSMLMNLPY